VSETTVTKGPVGDAEALCKLPSAVSSKPAQVKLLGHAAQRWIAVDTRRPCRLQGNSRCCKALIFPLAELFEYLDLRADCGGAVAVPGSQRQSKEEYGRSWLGRCMSILGTVEAADY